MKQLILSNSDSIQKTLDEYLDENEIVIRLKPGIYKEKISIDNDNVVIEGDSSGNTIITFCDYNYKIHEDGQIFNTFRTPTLNVLGKNVTLKNLTVRNDSGNGPDIGQAVALSVYGDGFKAFDCQFHGYQDTIFCGPLPVDLTVRYKDFLPKSHLHTEPVRCDFKNCLVTGSVDFIFGSAQAFFKSCKIVATHKGYIVAPSTYQDQDHGFVFIDCTIENLSDTDQVYLARPWRAHGATAFINCRFLGRIHPERYHDWEKPIYRFQEYPYIESRHSKEFDILEAEQLINCGGNS